MEAAKGAAAVAEDLRMSEPLRLSEDREHRAARAIATRFQRERGWQYVGRVAGSGGALVARRLLEVLPRSLLYVVADGEQARRAQADLEFFLDEPVLSLTGPDTDPYAQVQPDRRATMTRLGALSRLALGSPSRVCVVDAAGLVRKVVPREVLRSSTVTVETEAELDPSVLAEQLSRSGYLRVPVVEDPGSFAIRGSLIDVWGSDAPLPVRIELFGDWVLHIKSFDPETQRSEQEIQKVNLPPAREMVLLPSAVERAREALREASDAINYPSTKTRQLIEDLCSGRQPLGAVGFLPAFYQLESLWDYLPADVDVLIENPEQLLPKVRSELERAEVAFQARNDAPKFPLEALFLAEDALEAQLGSKAVLCLAPHFVQGRGEGLDRLEMSDAQAVSAAQSDQRDLQQAVAAARSSRGKRAALDPLVERLALWHEHGLKVELVARTHAQARRLATLLRHRDVPLEAPRDEQEGAFESTVHPWAVVRVGALARGVIAPLDGGVWVTEEEIFGQRAQVVAARPKRKGRALLEDLRALKPGDHVVHVEHGVGRYVGLENRPGPGGGQIELLVVEYLGGKLYLPVYRLNQIQKFTGGDAPKLDRLGGQSFAKTKAKARRKAREMADELLRLYAERNNATKEPVAPADDEFEAFEASFPYDETPDQAAAIADVMADLAQPRVMDRLVCGDVGFGKTEVALRAAFRVTTAGKQVAVLCPTTVLAQQHYLTFSRRLADYPLEVRVLSRFQTKKEISETLQGLARGTVDIVVGTHRMLSKDVAFKNLGLLVIDEEQRFGVAHKERLKQMRTSVDVLTLTATPIPRTLQLAVGGLRDMSIISTPPVNRRAIRTLISRFDESIVREAIERELNRGGQVFYVYNRVEGLYERAKRLEQLVPQARIAVGHGQMRETSLERAMLDFVEGEADILVSTAIVESGLDIPRANTMIVDRADLFGLSQLYQLRGRVGRSQERAYCYLLVPAPSEMSDDARERLEALERYTELGSGFHVAALDMELRGTGDLLGAEQSGAVASVGMELFCQMLEEATAELRGEEVGFDIEPELSFDVEALIPDDYVTEVGVRLSLYKRLASARDEAEVAHLAVEMEDRFGPPPLEAQRFVELMRLKVELRRLKVMSCEAAAGRVALRLRHDTPLDAAALAEFVSKAKGRYRLSPDGRLVRQQGPDEAVQGSLEFADRMLEELAQVRQR